MPLRQGSSTIGTVIGVLVMLVAVIGSVFFDWSWNNPDTLPLIIGVVVAVGAGILMIHRIWN